MCGIFSQGCNQCAIPNGMRYVRYADTYRHVPVVAVVHRKRNEFQYGPIFKNCIEEIIWPITNAVHYRHVVCIGPTHVLTVHIWALLGHLLPISDDQKTPSQHGLSQLLWRSGTGPDSC